MHKKTKIALTAIAMTALGVGTLTTRAIADRGGDGGGDGQHGGDMRHLVQRYDANKDGKVSQQEIDTNRTEWHARFDSDKNGSLSLKEFEALWLEARRREIVREFQQFDPNGDAAVSLDEYKEPLSSVVADRDQNGDGLLSRDDKGRDGKGRDGKGRHKDRDGDGDRDKREEDDDGSKE